MIAIGLFGAGRIAAVHAGHLAGTPQDCASRAHGAPPLVTAEDGRCALILADAAMRSARTGQPVTVAR